MAENNQGHVRIFIAIELPQETKQTLSRLQQRLKQACGNCPTRWVAPENIHLTIAFLGDVCVSKLDTVKEAVFASVAGKQAFDLTVTGTGAFPDLEHPSIVWAGLGGELDILLKIQKRLAESLTASGFAPNNRPFSPHLTLARVRDEALSADKKRLGQTVASTVCETDCAIHIDKISLIQSQLTSSGPIYSVLFYAPLKE